MMQQQQQANQQRNQQQQRNKRNSTSPGEEVRSFVDSKNVMDILKPNLVIISTKIYHGMIRHPRNRSGYVDHRWNNLLSCP